MCKRISHKIWFRINVVVYKYNITTLCCCINSMYKLLNKRINNMISHNKCVRKSQFLVKTPMHLAY